MAAQLDHKMEALHRQVEHTAHTPPNPLDSLDLGQLYSLATDLPRSRRT